MNKMLFFLFFLSLCVRAVRGQTDSSMGRRPTTKELEVSDPNDPHADVTAPYFPGGNDSLMRFIKLNFKFPEGIKEIKGREIVKFFVETNGTLSQIHIVAGISPKVDQEMVRVINLCPRWSPCLWYGTKRKLSYSISVSFPFSEGYRNHQSEVAIDAPSNNTPIDTNTVYTSVEKVPEFPGGWDKFKAYIKNNVLPTASPLVEGRVILTFVVERNGSLTGIKVGLGVSAADDQEALRLMRGCPKWNPGIRNGKPVRVLYSVPIEF